MAGGARKTRRLHPTDLVLHGVDEVGVDDHVIDRVVAQDYRFAEFECLVAEDEIVGAIVGCDLEPAHFSDRRAAKCHRWPQHELHAFHGSGSENAAGHFYGHADGFKARPETALYGNAAIGAGHATDVRVGEREGNGAEVVRGDADVAVADDEDVMIGGGFHDFHGGYFGVDVVGLTLGGEELCWDIGVTGRYSARYFESEVVRSAGAEEDFVCRIILTEEGFQFGFKAGLRSVQRLEEG